MYLQEPEIDHELVSGQNVFESYSLHQRNQNTGVFTFKRQ